MKVYVLYDVVNWSTAIEGRPDRRDYHHARRGEYVDIPDADVTRFLALDPPAVSKDADAVEAATAAAGEPPSWSDEQLASASVDDTVAYLTQHPTEAQRVLDAEQAKDRPRKTLIDAATRVRANHEEELGRLAEERQAAEEREQAAYAATSGAAPAAPRIPGAGS